jgi:hypothetical protein
MQVSEVQPFAKTVPSAGGGDELLRLGYRIAGSSADFATLDVPLSVVREAIALDISIRVTPTGTVSVSTEHYDSGGKAGNYEVSLVQLVEATLNPHNMHMEEATASELTVFLEGLEHSARLVRAAIGRLSDGQLEVRSDA